MRNSLTILSFGLALAFFAAFGNMSVMAEEAEMPAEVTAYVQAVADVQMAQATMDEANAEVTAARLAQGMIDAHEADVALQASMVGAGLDTTEIDERIGANAEAYATAVACLADAEAAIEPAGTALSGALAQMSEKRDAAMIYASTNGFATTLDAMTEQMLATANAMLEVEAERDDALADSADRDDLAAALVDHCTRNETNTVCDNPAVAAVLAAAAEEVSGEDAGT